MSQTLLMRDRSIQLTDAEKDAAHKAFTVALRGVDEPNQKRWLKILKKMFTLEHGEITEISTRMPRSGPFHRFHMAMEQAVFDGQDRFTHFDQMRNWIKIACGFVTWVPGARGGIVPLPKSISYAELDEPEMREFHESMLAFFRGPHAAPFLWKNLTADKAAETMEAILSQFERQG